MTRLLPTCPLPLTPRQLEVREFVARGWSSKEIARKLELSTRTVEDHRRDIFERMAVRNVVEMMRVMYRLDENESPSITPERGLENAVSNAQS
jgi:DNA-binding NarL/FixJ family response regulator